MVSRMTPMHEPAIMPGEVIFQVEAMKQESIVYQFHSICLVGAFWSASGLRRQGPVQAGKEDAQRSCNRHPCPWPLPMSQWPLLPPLLSAFPYPSWLWVYSDGVGKVEVREVE